MSERPEIPENIIPGEYFDKLLKDRVNKSGLSKIESLNATIQFNITDSEEGIWNVVIERGLVRKVTRKNMKPTCSFHLDGATFLSILRREITPQQAFFSGKATIGGNMFLALKMNILVQYL
ncbi:MAG: SCP2 sterol-binding domain-containing protein [Candidatus Brocadiaceae bacterium]|nr:SCP2 sterol-binding domain-containing protein [Candidatus Brocadiaceae bacterium]